MSEEKKYSVIGRVEIGTDEYRELIEGLANAENELRKTHSDYWRESQRADKAVAENEDLREKNDQFLAFIKDEGLNEKYKLWLFERAREKEEEQYGN